MPAFAINTENHLAAVEGPRSICEGEVQMAELLFVVGKNSSVGRRRSVRHQRVLKARPARARRT